MKFGLFYEQQLPRPWNPGDEQRVFHEALDQIELADRLGYDYAWEVEHHFLEEYAHSAAPEVFLGAVSQRTKQIRIGHGVMLMVPGINHPARCAERLGTLDILSNGRLEWGTGESSSAMELEGFGVSIGEKREMWREGVEQCARMMAMSPYPGHEGRYFSMPCRNVIPKPVQKPHPPLWMACNNVEAAQAAATNGMGALVFQFADAEKAKPFVDAYYDTIRSDRCVPLGYSVNANICIISALAIHQDRAEADRRAHFNFGFFGRTLKHFYADGEHQPGHTSIAAMFDEEIDPIVGRAAIGGVGTPDDVRGHLRALEAIGADQVGFVRQFGRTTHAEMCQELRTLADEVMPEFRARQAEAERRKAEELAPFIAAALARRRPEAALSIEETPSIMALPKRAALAQAAGRAMEPWERQRLDNADTSVVVDAVLANRSE